MPVTVSRDDVIAFRLAAHHLDERLAASALLDAAGRCGIQNSPPGSALLALHARVRDVTPERLEAAVAEEKSLLQTWSVRGSPFYFPTSDAPVFTTGVLPPTGEALGHFLPGVAQTLDELDLSIVEAVELTGAEIHEVLTGRRLAIDELGAEIATRIAPKLTKRQRERWAADGPYAAGQPLGEGIVHFCVRILTLRGTVCFAPRSGNKAPFVLVDEWLGAPIPAVDPEVARAELLRKYLRGYGPSTPADFAAWLGVGTGDTDAWWRLVDDELTPVEFGGTTWIRTADVDSLRAAQRPQGVRLLPPRDPYTQMRDRETIVEKRLHRTVWKTLGDPGTVLVDGEITGTWRPRRNGKKLTVTVSAFGGPPPERVRTALLDEAEQVAALRGASSVDVGFADG